MSAATKKRTGSSIPPRGSAAGARGARFPAAAAPAPGSPRRWPMIVSAVVGVVGILFLVNYALRKPPPTKTTAPAESADSLRATDGVVPAPRPVFEPAGAAQGATTVGVLTARGPTCLECAKQNGCLNVQQGGSCEGLTGYSGTCGTSEKDMCYRILNRIFATKCAETLQQVPCLCGDTDAEACLNGSEKPNGPLYHEYQCSFNTTDVVAIQAKFRDPAYGAGQANALVQC